MIEFIPKYIIKEDCFLSNISNNVLEYFLSKRDKLSNISNEILNFNWWN